MKPRCLALLTLLSGAFGFGDPSSIAGDTGAQIRTPVVWHVALEGSDETGDGSSERPFRTIQRGIDRSNAGDMVQVREGIYSGPANRNLNFHGKPINLTSAEPESDLCITQTIIDPQGEGVVFRFVNDEGPGTAVAGFTLRPGNTSGAVRGVRGFFELSPHAQPITRRLRLESHEADSLDQRPETEGSLSIVSSTIGYPTADRGVFWNGHDPFHHPVNTTDYYGSGDIDLDGEVTNQDAWLASQIVAGSMRAVVRADADGNGIYDNLDALLIKSAANGASLPAWWNALHTKAQRDSWIDKILARDPTDEHPAQSWFLCLNYAVQMFLRCSTYGFDIAGGSYTYGQTVFNVPVYCVAVTGEQYGHSINAVLTGDNPLAFDDWRFIEPQTDEKAAPGQWDMPFGTQLKVLLPEDIQGVGHNNAFIPVRFNVLETGVTLTGFDPGLILDRDYFIPESAENRLSMWNPMIAPSDPPLLFYERTRNDSSRVADIHVAELFSADWSAGRPLVSDSNFANLLDVQYESNDRIHVLWRGKPGYLPGIFHGYLNSTDRKLIDLTRVSDETQDHVAFSGRLVVGADGNIHVFWLDSEGIRWSCTEGDAWKTSTLLLARQSGPHFKYYQRDRRRSAFAAEATSEGDIVLVAAESEPTTLLELRYHGGAWGPPQIIEQAAPPWYFAGVDLAAGPGGSLHLAYCRSLYVGGNILSPLWGTGPLYTRTRLGGSWSSRQALDEGYCSSARLAVSADGTARLVWLRHHADKQQAVGVWAPWRDGAWRSQNLLSATEGADVWYPAVECLDNSTVEAVWCERSSRGVAIGRQTLRVPGRYRRDGLTHR